jgi:hypothetical protein
VPVKDDVVLITVDDDCRTFGELKTGRYPPEIEAIVAGVVEEF